MTSRFIFFKEEFNRLEDDEIYELWTMPRVMHIIVKKIATEIILEIESRQQADRLLNVPKAAEYLQTTAYRIRNWLDGGLLRNENPADGYALMSVKQLDEFREQNGNLFKSKQRKVRAVPAGAKDYRKVANG